MLLSYERRGRHREFVEEASGVCMHACVCLVKTLVCGFCLVDCCCCCGLCRDILFCSMLRRLLWWEEAFSTSRVSRSNRKVCFWNNDGADTLGFLSKGANFLIVEQSILIFFRGCRGGFTRKFANYSPDICFYFEGFEPLDFVRVSEFYI